MEVVHSGRPRRADTSKDESYVSQTLQVSTMKLDRLESQSCLCQLNPKLVEDSIVSRPEDCQSPLFQLLTNCKLIYNVVQAAPNSTFLLLETIGDNC